LCCLPYKSIQFKKYNYENDKILKAILFGIIAGAAIFFMHFHSVPFGFLLIFFIIRFFAFRRWVMVIRTISAALLLESIYTQRWHSMSDESVKHLLKNGDRII